MLYKTLFASVFVFFSSLSYSQTIYKAQYAKFEDGKTTGTITLEIEKKKGVSTVKFNSNYEETSFFFFKTPFKLDITATFINNRIKKWDYTLKKRDRRQITHRGNVEKKKVMQVIKPMRTYSTKTAHCSSLGLFFIPPNPRSKTFLDLNRNKPEPQPIKLKVNRTGTIAMLQTYTKKTKISYDKFGIAVKIVQIHDDGLKTSIVRKKFSIKE
ncbi:MAG: hypothetical protein U9O87_02395 [Verrucomicrobiota bacterium]|nr:hypothetical protein [Verrucomicrobiota bacterium]